MGGCSCRNSTKIYIKETTFKPIIQGASTKISEEDQWKVIFKSVYGDKNRDNNKLLLALDPQLGILGLLDLIFDYLSLEDLQKCQGVCRLFCQVACLDKLCYKYCSTESNQIDETMQVNVISPDENAMSVAHHSPEVRTKALIQIKNQKNHQSGEVAVERYQTQKLSVGGSPTSPTKTFTRPADESFLKPKIVQKFEKYGNMLAPIRESFEQDALMSAQSPICKKNPDIEFKQDDETFSSEDISSIESSISSSDTESCKTVFGKVGCCIKKQVSVDKTSNNSAYCKSPAIPVAKKIFIRMNYGNKDMRRPTLGKTMVFNDHMNEVYSDNSHYEKCLVTIDSQDLSHDNLKNIVKPKPKCMSKFGKRYSLAARHSSVFSEDVEPMEFIKNLPARMLIGRDLQSIEESVNESSDLIPLQKIPSLRKKRKSVMPPPMSSKFFRAQGVSPVNESEEGANN
ncbi:unnamed protein product [Moneuplotes crassus]|uniref:F-box domain-containing protein n=1 Tax=Euplotes crassus TaxID=5936 RepID=A0AAD1Y210_EUPCR|nr:unnamed protein product [Moneuplotes crassus]